ncbi:MAG: DUF6443 domain-containing protein, partial [bacterium]
MCGQGSFNALATPGAQSDQIRWYNQLSGGTLLHTGNTYSATITNTTTYYAASFNSSLSCESNIRTPLTVTVNSIPLSPAVLISSVCGSGQASATVGLGGDQVKWYLSPSGNDGVATGTQSTIESTSKNFYITTFNSSTGCESSPRILVALEVISIPQITSSSDNLLVYGKEVNLSTAGNYFSYQWFRDNELIPTITTQTWKADRTGLITVKVKTSSLSAQCTSAPYEVKHALHNQPAPVNFVSTTQILKEGVNENDGLFNLNLNEVNQTVTFLDGMGRGFQTVAVGKSGDFKDIIYPTEYSKFGLSDTSFLPYVSSNMEGRLRKEATRKPDNLYDNSEQKNFYVNTAGVASDNMPFSSAVRFKAPDGRILEQGAVGTAWQPGQATVKYMLTTNNTNYPVRYWNADGTTSSNYPNNSVMVNITTDENNNVVRTFTNQQGLTILKQVQEATDNWLQTYFVYDDYGRLKYQVPPKAVNLLDSNPNLESDANLLDLIYKYVYDSLGRVVETKIPGAAAQYTVYDKRGRVALIQNGKLRESNQWMFTKYDARNRAIYAGIYTNTLQTTRSSMQNLFNTYSGIDYEAREVNATYHGYSNQVFPTTGLEVLTINYYDDYDFDRNDIADYAYDGNHLNGLPATNTVFRNTPTGAKKKLLGTNTWLVNVVFYDRHMRVIQTLNNNHLNLTSSERNSVLYDFAGHVLKAKNTHQGLTTVQTEQRYEYDANWRTKKIFHKVDNHPEQEVVHYEYNPLGQLVDKKLHATTPGNYLQSIDYRYT